MIREETEEYRRNVLDILIRRFHLESPYLKDPGPRDKMLWEGRPVSKMNSEELKEAVDVAQQAIDFQKGWRNKRIEFELACKARKVRR